MSIRLYVGNLPKEIERKELQDLFVEMGDTITTKVITDRKTGKCRGFGFVTVKTDEEADQFIEKYNGVTLKESTLKIEKALPRTKGNKQEKGGEGESNDAGEQEEPRVTPAPVIKANQPAGGSGNSNSERSSNSGGNRRSNKSRRGGNTNTSTTTSTSSESVQPDPRWASELEKLKQMLAQAGT